MLGAPTRPGQPRTAVVLEQRQLALRAVGADPDLFDLLEQVCRERVGALPDRRDLRARAENVIVELLPCYLEQGVYRPKSIAALLGYKDLSSFYHAFRRWTGTTPAQFSQDPRVSCNFPGRT